MNIDNISTALVVLIGVPAATVLYVVAAERAMAARLSDAARRKVRPWVWLAPALAFLGVYLIYPTIQTIILSLKDRRSRNFVGLDNFSSLLSSSDFLIVLRNTLLWVVVFSGVVVILGLILAVLTDRVPYEVSVKSLIFVPLALSFVAAGVIWTFMYDFDQSIGTVNAVWTSTTGREPMSLLTEQPRNTFMLIIVGIWMWVGFALVILSAAVKGIPRDLLEAARIDGANELQVFFRIILPLLMPTVAVVGTTLVITALKTFDIVFVMTAGNFDTGVIANEFYLQRFIRNDAGSASAVAVILLLAIIPVMLINIRRFRAQEAIR